MDQPPDIVKEISAGLFATGIDLVLLAASFGFNWMDTTSYHRKDPTDMFIDTLKLAGIFQEKMLTACLAYAKAKGYLRGDRQDVRLTSSGRRRLVRSLPVYRDRRPWDGRLHLITYDIKESSRAKRFRLIAWLKQHQAIMLQKSVWVSVKDLSRDLYRENVIYHDEGAVLSSSLKSGEGISGKTIKELAEKWYVLDELNRRYEMWLSAARARRKNKQSLFFLKMRYLKILREDPQLPRELLLANWLGDKAYHLYKSIIDR